MRVGFVENQHFYLVEPQSHGYRPRSTQAAGRGHKHLGAARQCTDLAIDRHVADRKKVTLHTDGCDGRTP